MNRYLQCLVFCSLMGALSSSCTPPTTKPIGTVELSHTQDTNQGTLLVFLPGLRDRASVFAGEGFVSAVERSGIKADIIGVEAHIGYYLKKEFPTRLKEDVVVPARQHGYRNIWLVGISLGGFGAIWYDVENPGDVTGIVVLAPYLGEPEVVAEIASAGGLMAWNPPAEAELDDQHRIWRGVKIYERPEKNLGRIYLGYGLADKFALPDSLLARVIPGNQVFTIAGGHDWSTWRSLWDSILKCGAIGSTR